MIETQATLLKQAKILFFFHYWACILILGEAIQKKVGIVSIGVQGEFKLEPVVLQTVRPFIFVSKCLTEFKKLKLDEKDEKKMQENI